MSSRSSTTFRVVAIGFLVGLLIGVTSYWLAERYPNVGVLFLSSAVPVYLSWKIPLQAPLWSWFVGYYSTIGVGISGFYLNRGGKLRILGYCLACLVVIHYLATFLIAREIAKVSM